MNHQGNKFLIKKNNRKQKKTTKMVAHDMKLNNLYNSGFSDNQY
jgi:hypothetical protein